MIENSNYKVSLTIFISFICILLTLGVSVSSVNKYKSTLEQKHNEYKENINKKDIQIAYYDSVATAHNLERERVMESFNKIINEKDKEIQRDLSKYYTNHDSITWNELDSLLAALLKK